MTVPAFFAGGTIRDMEGNAKHSVDDAESPRQTHRAVWMPRLFPAHSGLFMRTARLAAFAALVVLPAVAQAQSATVAATATVVTPLVVTGTAGLAFGNVFQGVNKTVLFSDATSGRFSITGFGASQVAMTFTLPANLANGATNLPIDSWDVRSNATNVTAGATALTVTSGTPVNANLTAGSLFLFVGGRVLPAVAQAAGAYTGNIVLAAAYTGL